MLGYVRRDPEEPVPNFGRSNYGWKAEIDLSLPTSRIVGPFRDLMDTMIIFPRFTRGSREGRDKLFIFKASSLVLGMQYLILNHTKVPLVDLPDLQEVRSG
jgi:hypothetical protein